MRLKPGPTEFFVAAGPGKKPDSRSRAADFSGEKYSAPKTAQNRLFPMSGREQGVPAVRAMLLWWDRVMQGVNGE